jgi:cytochrome c
MSQLVLACVMFLASGIVAPLHAQDPNGAAGQALYREHCGVCHGLIASEGTEQRLPPPAWAPIRVAMLASASSGQQLAVAPPYGPPLRGIYGRPAGSVPGFAYSRAFKRVLQGVVWDGQTLERWITDSQAWVPGSLMFYAQPDAEIRRQIITYLQTQR